MHAQELVGLHPLLLLDEGLGLAHDDLVEHGEVARVVAHRVLDEEDDADEPRARVGVDVAQILDVLEHPDEELGVAVPDEDPVHEGELGTARIEGREARVVGDHEEDGHAGPDFLHRARESQGSVEVEAGHQDDEIEAALAEEIHGLLGSCRRR